MGMSVAMSPGSILIAEQSREHHLGQLGHNDAQLTIASVHHRVKSTQCQRYTLAGVLDLVEILTSEHIELFQRHIPFSHPCEEGMCPYRVRHHMVVHPSEQLFNRLSAQALLEASIRIHGEIAFQDADFLRQV